MWELDHKEGQALKNWCFWTAVLEKTLESPLDCKEIQPVNPKGNQSWIFTGRTDAEAEAPILWPPDMKNWLIGKDPDPGKDWQREKKGTTEDETVGWHHQLDGHEFEQALGVGDGQGSLVCCSLLRTCLLSILLGARCSSKQNRGRPDLRGTYVSWRKDNSKVLITIECLKNISVWNWNLGNDKESFRTI